MNSYATPCHATPAVVFVTNVTIEFIYILANKIMKVPKAINELSDQEFIIVQCYRMFILLSVIRLYC